ncbi:MAG: Rieske 2Fe-2S domain-containing protein [bacterium]|nr:Rieske 2Fe-2S domain-containing protein [bacterium]
MTRRIDLPPYPRGWFAVSASTELARSEVQHHHYFGQELVLFRTEDGTAALFDAHCPHLGAHFGHGGRVEGNDLVCPFHGWSFGVDGACRSMPYGKRIPKTAQARRWPLREKYGVILAWHCPKGSEPDWEMPEFDDSNWTACISKRWEIAGHPQEVCENQADYGHFIFVHGTHFPRATAEPMIEGPVLQVDIESDPEAIEEKYRVDGPELVGSNCGHGPGLTFATIVPKDSGLTALQRLYATPIDEERLALLGVVSVGKLDHDDATQQYLDGLSQAVFAQWEADVPLWETKVYRPTPALNDAEGSVAVFRRWYEQFYVDD